MDPPPTLQLLNNLTLHPLASTDSGASMGSPGFKVLHSPDLDYGVTCQTLDACLAEVQ